jgi:hypothetical protein
MKVKDEDTEVGGMQEDVAKKAAGTAGKIIIFHSVPELY